MDSEFKNVVVDRMDCAKKCIEDAILKNREQAFLMAVGQLIALYGLAERFEFVNSAELKEIDGYIDRASDRFYKI